MLYIITIKAFLTLLINAGSFLLDIDEPEWTQPYYGHQN